MKNVSKNDAKTKLTKVSVKKRNTTLLKRKIVAKSGAFSKKIDEEVANLLKG